MGITAGALGAAEARLTDNVTFVAEANIETNFSDSDAARERTQVSKLRWGDSEEIAAVRPPFDLILGSDIIYHKDSNDELADTIAALSGPGTVVLWATPDGAGGDDSAPAYGSPVSDLGAEFFTRLREVHGFEMDDISEDDEVVAAIDEVSPTTGAEAGFDAFSTYYVRGPIRLTRMHAPAAAPAPAPAPRSRL